MKKKLFMCVLALTTICMNVSLIKAKEHTIDLVRVSENVYAYNALEDGYVSDFSSTLTPTYYVYAGQLNEDEAESLLDELEIVDNVHEWAASIQVITPVNGLDYAKEDADAFIELLGVAVSNAKVIGIDEGATFVNNYISQECWAVAGMMTYGGEMNEGLDYDVAIPVYLSHPSEEAIAYYVHANQATKVNENVYVNESDTLQKVVVGNDETLAEAFDHAWNEIFSKNYRQHNEKTEFYMTNAVNYTDPYLLIEIPDFDTLKVNYYSYYNQSLNGEGQYTWFEYIPESTLAMKNGTVPLIVTLHGNGNDARLQGETTGWVELAAQENLMVVAPEWQDIVLDSGTHEPGPNFFHCDGLEGDKLIEWIEMLKVKYPQIDESRIYVTGLSAGGSASILYGAKYNKVFAGVGAVSAPGVDKAELAEVVSQYQGDNVPMIYVCGDHDFFGMIPVDLSSEYCFQVAEGVGIASVDENVDIFPYIQNYQKINGLTVADTYDLSLNPYYGIALDNQQWIQLGVKDTLEGTLSNENGVIMKFAAIKDQAHWNYKPEAEYIWNFLKHYSRDTMTGALMIDGKKNDVSQTPVKDVTSTEDSPTTTQAVQTGDSNAIFTYTAVSLFALASFIKMKQKKNNEGDKNR